MASAGDDVVVGVGGERGGRDHVDRQHDPALASARSSSSRQVSTWSASSSDFADLVALGGEEGEAHAAADEQLVDLAAAAPR